MLSFYSLLLDYENKIYYNITLTGNPIELVMAYSKGRFFHFSFMKGAIFVKIFVPLGMFLLVLFVLVNGVAYGQYSSLGISQDAWVGVHNTTSHDILGCVRIDSNTSMAVGTAGLMLKTTNGGVNWFAHPTGVSADLYSVYFLNSNLGWAVGTSVYPAGSTFLATTDGGATWKSQIPPASFTPTLYSVYFQDANNGWAVGSSGRCALTTNGGTNWVNVTMPVAATYSLYSVRFRDAHNGYIVGGPTGQGFVMQTTNGGQSWTDPVQVASQPLNAVRFVDTSTAVAVGNNGAIVQTTDGGQNWNTQSTPSGAFRPLKGLSVVGNTVFAAGDTVVIVSTNGGANWTRKRTNLNGTIYPYQLLNDVAMATPTSGWAIGVGGLIYHTTDGGTTWAYQLQGTNNLAFDADLYSVYFLNSNLGWAVGTSVYPAGSTFLATTDGGTTWKSQTPPASFTPTLYSVYFQDANNGWAVGSSGRCALTTNGGTNWVNVTMPVAATYSLYSVRFRDAHNGYIVGGPTGQGFVMQTTNGGQSWADPVQVASQPLYAVAYVDSLTAVAVGSNGAIVQTTDGGADWNTQSTPSGAFRPLKGISVVGSNVFAAGDTVVVVSTNGGANWTRKRTNLNGTIYPYQLLNGIAMATKHTGWAVGAAGLIYNTNDGGTTWTLEPSPYPTQDILGISFVENTACFVGLGGTIARNTTPFVTAVNEPSAGSIPQQFKLMQSFPNPFNPTATIRYELPTASRVSLTVYNVLGQVVATLVNGVEEAGTKSVQWNALGFASGVYFYKLDVTGVNTPSKTFTQVNKMVLVK